MAQHLMLGTYVWRSSSCFPATAQAIIIRRRDPWNEMMVGGIWFYRTGSKQETIQIRARDAKLGFMRSGKICGEGG